ncbi:carbohydrate ABC transporter permease [Agromyces ramosus]|uniref:Multiple sugar transport system permease protein n=1 Tax=Agromyces ramosus TaxID=33879 RepID=A0ABU0R7E9_9MICO|nr:carbohydrate ABC transporter permease [Agromyces ramosus]MDQ0893999.1 multiple sugar transport system permease protein [Agromyces ramosus]
MVVQIEPVVVVGDPQETVRATERPRRRRRLRFGPGSALRLITMYGFAVFCLVPLLWLVLAPSKDNAEMLSTPLSWGSFERYALSWQHLAEYSDGVIFRWMANSVLYSIVPLVITVVISLLAAYALATMRFAGRKVILLTTLLAIVLPATAMVLPLFLELNAVGLINTAASVILPAAFFPFGVYLAFVFFATSMPKELLEAARIDGCSELGVFLRVVLPLSKPVIGLLVFFSFVANWNNYFLPYVMLTDSSMFNLPVGLGTLIASTPALNPSAGGSILPITYPEAAMAGLIVVVPVAILFLFFQRFLVRGILAGSTKG